MNPSVGIDGSVLAADILTLGTPQAYRRHRPYLMAGTDDSGAGICTGIR
ncbi:MAG: hypothetical protein ACU841_05145 [Gammaproteobacteria bacterium]